MSIKKCAAKDPATCRFHRTDRPVNVAPKIKVGARQNHGFANEAALIEKYKLDFFGRSYTGKFDGVFPKDGLPVSIKTEKLGSDVELADYFRNASIDHDYYMIVSFWEGSKDNIVSNYYLKVVGSEWAKLFDNKWHAPFKQLLADASNQRSYDEEWREKVKALKESYGSDSIIRLRPKRDHKIQKRMQCAISYKDFLEFADKNKTDAFEKDD